MAKKFDIYVDGFEGRTFDLELSRGVMMCDIIVYSIPHRDALRVESRLALDACLRQYTLYRTLASRSSMALVGHIDRMMAICRNRLGVTIDVTAELGAPQLQKTSKAKNHTGVQSGVANLLYGFLNEGASGAGVCAHIADMQIGVPVSGTKNALGMDASVSLPTLRKQAGGESRSRIWAEMLLGQTEKILSAASAAGVVADVTFSPARYRRLADMDADTLGAYDAMTLREAGYILIE